MSAEIFVEISGGEHQKETFTSGGRSLTLGAKQQGCPQRFKLPWIFLWNRRTARAHPWFWSGTHRKRWHWHSLILAKGPRSVKIFPHH